MKQSALIDVVEPVITACGLELDKLTVVRAGARHVVRITLDGDGPSGHGPDLDEIAEATRAISAALDESDAAGQAPYTLEVSSRGVSAPLARPAHWRRNAGRLVTVHTTDGEQFTGRITDSDDTAANLAVDGRSRRIDYSQVRKAVVQIEMNRKDQED
ncbi:ribosome maturation factor RimP [Propionibacterium cyclohexanicum]|uniref:Ribosome maturation factor RimP n=1 Tax=Propionibacterium cyclohexanicum TaxID=64702 RepID=A0A1H9PPI8_9ACTN|nr:ribosome maturation factor RimP [Propionibacterium cyclohexanicum]SER49715.1 ribosome maturation factor RimP [Propionibacterium cyclohexanicum]